jgi:2-oxoacid:acceptor oxidoreductase gamma subunit (pyruvate/2-ketoisovalerate family)
MAKDNRIIEIRWHGRGGQGTITASNFLAKTAFKQGYKGVQSIPLIGAERRGAPVKAFTRISKEEIRIHSQIYEPDIVIVMDPTLYYLYKPVIIAGLKEGSILLINSSKILNAKHSYQIKSVDATGIAIKLGLEVAGQPVINAPMLGAFAKVTGILNLESLEESIREEWPGKWAEKNVEAVKKAYEIIS